MAGGESTFSRPQTEVAEPSGSDEDVSGIGISQEILTKIRGNILSKNAYGGSVSSLKWNILRVGTRVLAAWDKSRYYKGLIVKIDDDAIHVFFDMGGRKRYSGNPGEKIVIDRKASAQEYTTGCRVLVRPSRGKSFFRGVVHSTGSVRGFNVAFDDLTRERVWKRSKCLRLITDCIVKRDSTDDKDTTFDTSYQKTKTVNASAKIKDKNTNPHRKRILRDEVSEVNQCSSTSSLEGPPIKVPRQISPTMVQHKNKPSTLHPSKNSNDRGIIPQEHKEFSGQQSGKSVAEVKSQSKLPSNKQPNISASRPYLKHSNMVGTQSNPFHCKAPDSQLNISSFQPDVTDPRSSSTSFQAHSQSSTEPRCSLQRDVSDSRYNPISRQFNVADTRYNVFSYQSDVADPINNPITQRHQFDVADNLSNFESDVHSNLSYLNGHNTIADSQSRQGNFGSKYTQYTFEDSPSYMEKNNAAFIGGKVEFPLINTRQHNQTLVSANRNAIYYPQRFTPSSFGPRYCDSFSPPVHQMRKHYGCRGVIDPLMYEAEEMGRFDAPICPPLISNEDIEAILSDYSSDFCPSLQKQETKPSCLFQEYEYQASFTTIPDIVEYQNMAFTLEKDTVNTTSPFRLPFSDTRFSRSVSPLPFSHKNAHAQCFSQFDSREDVPPESYFHLSTCSYRHSMRPMFMMEQEVTTENTFPGPVGMAPMCQTTPSYSPPPLRHFSPPEDAYSLQPKSLIYPANFFSCEQQIPPAYPTQETVRTIPSYSATPHPPASSQLHSNVNADSSGHEKEANEKSESLNSSNSVELTAVTNYPPLTKESFQISDENRKSICTTLPTPHVQNREFNTSESVPTIDSCKSQFSELSDFVKFPLTAEERRMKILLAFGFKEFSSEDSRVAKENGEQTRESEGKNIQNNEASFPLNDKITTSQLTDTSEIIDLQSHQTLATVPAVQHNGVMTTLKSGLPSAQPVARTNGLIEDAYREINLRCNEVMDETDFDQLDTSLKEKDETTNDMPITTGNLEVKFVNEATIPLYVEASPLQSMRSF